MMEECGHPKLTLQPADILLQTKPPKIRADKSLPSLHLSRQLSERMLARIEFKIRSWVELSIQQIGRLAGYALSWRAGQSPPEPWSDLRLGTGAVPKLHLKKTEKDWKRLKKRLEVRRQGSGVREQVRSRATWSCSPTALSIKTQVQLLHALIGSHNSITNPKKPVRIIP